MSFWFNWWKHLKVVDVVVVVVVEDPDAVEAAGDSKVVKVVLAQVGSVAYQPEAFLHCLIRLES
jgi:hypothetical protein